jgi:hypothetical protein
LATTSTTITSDEIKDSIIQNSINNKKNSNKKNSSIEYIVVNIISVSIGTDDTTISISRYGLVVGQALAPNLLAGIEFKLSQRHGGISSARSL